MLALALLASVCVNAVNAAAPEVVDVAATDAAVQHYYEGEQDSALALVVASGISVGAGGGLLLVNDDLARGLGASLAVVGILGAAGFGFYLAVIPSMVADLQQRLSADPAGLAHQETQRLRMVIDRFVWLRLIEGAVATTGVVVAGVGAGTNNGVVTGVGLGVASGALGLFIYDSLAADRARLYRETFE